jgi:GntR family transcriptional regulator, transcriptional repressor for pyruvate dehydrogenase complex
MQACATLRFWKLLISAIFGVETPFKITGLNRRRVHESVADQIRQAIFGGLLAPGHKLPPEREMAERFETSRVALREALRALEQEGMISIKRGFNGGAFVADFDNALRALLNSLSTVVKLGQAKSAHLTEVRTILEPEITMLATLRATADDLSEIEAVVIAQEEELRNGELSRKLDMDFHRQLAAAAHNPILDIVVNSVNESIRDVISRSKRTDEMRARVVGYHRNIFEAVRSRDAKRARSVMTEHVVDVQCHLESAGRD